MEKVAIAHPIANTIGGPGVLRPAVPPTTALMYVLSFLHETIVDSWETFREGQEEIAQQRRGAERLDARSDDEETRWERLHETSLRI